MKKMLNTVRIALLTAIACALPATGFAANAPKPPSGGPRQRDGTGFGSRSTAALTGGRPRRRLPQFAPHPDPGAAAVSSEFGRLRRPGGVGPTARPLRPDKEVIQWVMVNAARWGRRPPRGTSWGETQCATGRSEGHLARDPASRLQPSAVRIEPQGPGSRERSGAFFVAAARDFGAARGLCRPWQRRRSRSR